MAMVAARQADIQVAYGGHRMAWWAVSEAGRAWVDAHHDWTTMAPEGVECLALNVDPLICRALISGLVVMAGDDEVTLR